MLVDGVTGDLHAFGDVVQVWARVRADPPAARGKQRGDVRHRRALAVRARHVNGRKHVLGPADGIDEPGHAVQRATSGYGGSERQVIEVAPDVAAAGGAIRRGWDLG